MIPQQVRALFNFIEFLELNLPAYKAGVAPCQQLALLDEQRSKLRPRENFKDKLQHDVLTAEILESFKPIKQNLHQPFCEKLLTLGIWTGDDPPVSIWNKNISAIQKLRDDFEPSDISEVQKYQKKYINFRTEANSDFLGLGFLLSSLDEVLKYLFEFFSDANENQFEQFEVPTIQVATFEEAISKAALHLGRRIRFSVFEHSFVRSPNQYPLAPPPYNFHIHMRDNIQVGNITNHSGHIVVGNNNSISQPTNDKNEIIAKINELLIILKSERYSGTSETLESLNSGLATVRTELSSSEPSSSKIKALISNVNSSLSTMVFGYDVTQAFEWLLKSLSTLIQ